MIAGLPLLFADGQFVSLDDMKDDQMEKFVTFLVNCSNLQSATKFHANPSDLSVCEPTWWLPDLPFVHPIKRPKKVTRKWRTKLKTLIKLCYKYYNLEMLIDLSADLSRQQSSNEIEFIAKCDHLTDIFSRKHRKILATIRRENMTYDLMHYQLKQHEISCSFLNEYCKEHNVDFVKNELDYKPFDDDPLQCKNEFLNYFQLTSKDNSFSSVVVHNAREYSSGRINFMNAPYIPFSSQLGRRLATKVKYFVKDQTHLKRLERLNRYLNTPPSPLSEISTNFIVTREKYLNHTWTHTYKFPGKTYGSHRNNSFRTAIVNSQCRPCSIPLIPISIQKFKFEPNSENIPTSKVEIKSEKKTEESKGTTNLRKRRLANRKIREFKQSGFKNMVNGIALRLSPRLNSRQTRDKVTKRLQRT